MNVEQFNGRPTPEDFNERMKRVRSASTFSELRERLSYIDQHTTPAQEVAESNVAAIQEAPKRDISEIEGVRNAIDEIFTQESNTEDITPQTPKSLEDLAIENTFNTIHADTETKHSHELGYGKEVVAYRIDNYVVRESLLYDPRSRSARKSMKKRANTLKQGEGLPNVEQLICYDEERNVTITNFSDGKPLDKLSREEIDNLASSPFLDSLKDTYGHMAERNIAPDHVIDNLLVDSHHKPFTLDYRTSKKRHTKEGHMLAFTDNVLRDAIYSTSADKRDSWATIAEQALSLSKPETVNSLHSLIQAVKVELVEKKIAKLLK